MKNRLYDDQDAQMQHVFGFALDNEDGHKRITQAEQFSVIGGSEETHERMTYTLIKTFEDLKFKGKSLQDTDPDELADIINKHVD